MHMNDNDVRRIYLNIISTTHRRTGRQLSRKRLHQREKELHLQIVQTMNGKSIRKISMITKIFHSASRLTTRVLNKNSMLTLKISDSRIIIQVLRIRKSSTNSLQVRQLTKAKLYRHRTIHILVKSQVMSSRQTNLNVRTRSITTQIVRLHHGRRRRIHRKVYHRNTLVQSVKNASERNNQRQFLTGHTPKVKVKLPIHKGRLLSLTTYLLRLHLHPALSNGSHHSTRHVRFYTFRIISRNLNILLNLARNEQRIALISRMTSLKATHIRLVNIVFLNGLVRIILYDKSHNERFPKPSIPNSNRIMKRTHRV